MSEEPFSSRHERARGPWPAVFGDYARRLRFSVAATASFMVLLPGAIGLLGVEEWPRLYCSVAGAIVLMIWTGLVSGHVKLALARPQARLLPRYPRTQVLAGASLVVPVCILSAVFHWTAGLSFLAAVALTLLVASLYWVGPYLFTQGHTLLILGPSLLLAVGQPPVLGMWSQVDPGWSGETWSALTILLSAALVGVVTCRMLHLNESSFEYSRDPSLGWRPGRSVDQDIPFTDLFNRFLPWFGRYRVTGLTSRFGADFPARVQLWRMGMSRSSPMVTGVSLAGMIALVGLVLDFAIRPERSPSTQAGVLVFYLIFFALVRTTYVHRRKDRLEHEALHPVSRERMVKEMGAATALDIAETWLFLWLGTLAARGLGLFLDVSWTTLLSYAAYTGGVTVLGIGLVPWALRLQGSWPSLLALSLGTLALGAPVAFALARGPGIEAVIPWAVAGAALAGIGVALGHVGYQHWCGLELGRRDL